MAELNIDLVNLKTNIKGLAESKVYESGTLFFISFDIANSTELKGRRAAEWPEIFQSFYTSCTKQVEDTFESRQWKKNGDEILFYLQFYSVDEVYKAISQIYRILNGLITNITKGPGKGILSVKATFWAAIVSDPYTNRENNKSPLNLIVRENYGNYDFIGPDIDFGFRISSKSAPGIVCIDPKIIYLLTISDLPEKALLNNDIKLVEVEILKGMWNHRYIPIYWYHPFINKPETIFQYDEYKRNKLVQKLVDLQDIQGINTVSKIIEEVGEDKKVKDMKNKLSGFTMVAPGNIKPKSTADLRLVAVLFDEERNKVFCAKRNTKKDNFPNTWEFGCTRLQAGRKITDILKKAYFDEFNLSIEHIIGEEDDPIVLSVFVFEDKKTRCWIPGLIFVGIAFGEIKISHNNRHSEAGWLSIEQALKLEDKETTVAKFTQHLERANYLLNSHSI